LLVVTIKEHYSKYRQHKLNMSYNHKIIMEYTYEFN